MTTLTQIIDGGNVKEDEIQNKDMSLFDKIVGISLLVFAILGWNAIFRTTSNAPEMTSHMAFDPEPSNSFGFLVLTFFVIFSGAIGVAYIVLFTTGKHAIKTLVAVFILGITLSMFIPSPSPPLTLPSWAEQRYGIQLDDSSVQSLGRLRDGGLLTTDGVTRVITLHSTQEGFLLYDNKNQQELPLKVTSK